MTDATWQVDLPKADFQPRFRRLLRRQLRLKGVTDKERSDVWEAWAINPSRIQAEMEKAYYAQFKNRRAVRGIEEIFYWLLDNWKLVLKILLTIVIVILAEEPVGE